AGPTKPVRLARVVRRTDGDGKRVQGTPIVVQVGRARVEVAADTDRAALSMVLQALAAAEWGARS
ncbi:MAG TPA: hypothetical protein VFG30_23780, partial [Polyangiales bacterium]|nr:hypothetical protein [Polyangiales bacterium]